MFSWFSRSSSVTESAPNAAPGAAPNTASDATPDATQLATWIATGLATEPNPTTAMEVDDPQPTSLLSEILATPFAELPAAPVPAAPVPAAPVPAAPVPAAPVPVAPVPGPWKPHVAKPFYTTPLHSAVFSMNVSEAKMLMEIHPEWVHERDEAGETPLLRVRWTHERAYDMMQCLLVHGADPDVQGRDQECPLSWVCGHTQYTDPAQPARLVQLLLSHGASPMPVPHVHGLTPLGYALRNRSVGNWDEVATLLQQAHRAEETPPSPIEVD
jgi:hypothetical protein